MTWIVWRQYRLQAAISAALLAAFAIFMIITGLHLATEWHADLLACGQSGNCQQAAGGLFEGDKGVGILVVLTLGVPAVLGAFWGAPLVAQEMETGTLQWAWTQSVTRRRWLAVKAGCLLLAAAVWGGAVSALVTWWSGPRNALYLDRFTPGNFDLQGIAPVGYALFAMGLGIMAGTLLRRTLPAMAVTIGGFIAVRIAVTLWLRQHYMAAVTTYSSLTSNVTVKGAYWPLTSGFTGPHGVIPTGGSVTANLPGGEHAGFGYGTTFDNVPYSALPASCQQVAVSSIGPGRANQGLVASCLQKAHFDFGAYHQFTTYQPASRFWAFQGIEVGVYAALAAVLLAVTLVVLRRRDA